MKDWAVISIYLCYKSLFYFFPFSYRFMSFNDFVLCTMNDIQIWHQTGDTNKECGT